MMSCKVSSVYYQRVHKIEVNHGGITLKVGLSNEDKPNIAKEYMEILEKDKKHKPYRHKIMDKSLVPGSIHGVVGAHASPKELAKQVECKEDFEATLAPRIGSLSSHALTWIYTAVCDLHSELVGLSNGNHKTLASWLLLMSTHPSLHLPSIHNRCYRDYTAADVN
ncbi:hypothetical protein F2Q69_00021290 [Brassica cretica]|uniref:Uncharacterized protein n=1 Tax=Brassica cretica TaxID=69181 RepID=A0A8S9Q804_BRACR|nr:hypothetical protein F2Q69_00021290 [Brassica cretica]